MGVSGLESSVYQNPGLIVNVDAGAAVADLDNPVTPIVFRRVAQKSDFPGLVERADIDGGLNDGSVHMGLSCQW